MVKYSICDVETKGRKIWSYEEYYIGEKDEKGRKTGIGENCWSGAKSLESCRGEFCRDTMHGMGEYRWRSHGPEGTALTYEGHFYVNRMHGYGTVSYTEGDVFNGLFYSNVRWGPGILSQLCLREDVGFWRGTQLMRLTWKPKISIIPDLNNSTNSWDVVKPHLNIMRTKTVNIGQVNGCSAIDLMKSCGADPVKANENYYKLYPTRCIDSRSPAFQVNVFNKEYYASNVVRTLEVITSESAQVLEETDKLYFSWNNNQIIQHIMKHCFEHDHQRSEFPVDIDNFLCGPREAFKPAGKHEIDCRTLLMASYLGHTDIVAQLINEHGIYPDVTDACGNTAVMYAVCGDETNVIHFLVEAGADVNYPNDSCCTALGMALWKFICVKKDISQSDMIQVVIPPEATRLLQPPKHEIFDWYFPRDSLLKSDTKLVKNSSKIFRNSKEMLNKRKSDDKRKCDLGKLSSVESLSENNQLYTNINIEFMISVTDNMTSPEITNPPFYLYEIHDLVQDIRLDIEEQKKITTNVNKTMEQSKSMSKVPNARPSIKGSIVTVLGTAKDIKENVLPSQDTQRKEKLKNILSTIDQLLSNGSNIDEVRCPQPALLTAVLSGSADLVRLLTDHGANIIEKYPQFLEYTPLDIAVSQPFTYDNLEIVRTLLERGAPAIHRLVCKDTGNPEIYVEGPTLLHAVLARKIENEKESEIQRQLLELLLRHNCDALAFFKGKSAMDSIAAKNMGLLDVFIESSSTNLNGIINDTNQSILVKMVSLPFFKTTDTKERTQTLTKLLLFGADPFQECQNYDDKFRNIFGFLNQTWNTIKPTDESWTLTGEKVNKNKIEQKVDKKAISKGLNQSNINLVTEYTRTIDLIAECARVIHVKWLQANLVKQMVKIINKYKHRHWNMILKELKNIRSDVSLWLNVERALEIWDILKTTKWKIYQNALVQKYLLCIVHHFCTNFNENNYVISFKDKNSTESHIKKVMREPTVFLEDIVSSKKTYTKHELYLKAEKKYDVCFDCSMPFASNKFPCDFCGLVAFCSSECKRNNSFRGCHPCAGKLISKYHFMEAVNGNAESETLVSRKQPKIK